MSASRAAQETLSLPSTRSTPTHTGVLLVGEAPGKRGVGQPALSGKRMRELGALRYRRVNLIPDDWPGRQGRGSAFPLREARERAREMWRLESLGVQFVFCGRRVERAFSQDPYPYFEWRKVWGRLVATAPHPSGLNRWWNDPGNVTRAELFFRSL